MEQQQIAVAFDRQSYHSSDLMSADEASARIGCSTSTVSAMFRSASSGSAKATAITEDGSVVKWYGHIVERVKLDAEGEHRKLENRSWGYVIHIPRAYTNEPVIEEPEDTGHFIDDGAVASLFSDDTGRIRAALWEKGVTLEDLSLITWVKPEALKRMIEGELAAPAYVIAVIERAADITI